MSIFDQIAAAAAQKDNYVDPGRVVTRRTQQTPALRPVRSAAPGFNPRGTSPAGGGSVSARLRAQASQAQAAPTEAEENGWGLGDGLSGIGRGLMEVLNVADMPRRAYQSVAGEVGDLVEGITPGNNGFIDFAANTLAGNPFQLRGLADENGDRDTGFDWGEVRRGITGDNAMSQGFMGRSTWDDDLPGFIRPVVGIAGDLATDPLTYVTGGTVKAGTKGATAAGRAVLPAGREALAMRGARTLGKDGIEGVVSREVGDRLIREGGTRGLGAVTPRGLRRAGASADEAAATFAGDAGFGLRIGVGSKQATLPGTRRIAESVNDLKGAIKKTTGASGAGRLSRELWTTSKYGENVLRQEILGGGTNAANAARGLAILGEAKGKSWRWFDEAIREGEKLGPDQKGLRKVSDDQARQITHALEAGDLNDPLVADLARFFEKKGGELQAAGVPFNARKGYVPHRLSAKARRAAEAGDEDVLRSGVVDMDLDAAERFQKIRQSDESIADINAKWRAEGHDYDLLEDDVRTLVTQYIGEGQQGLMRAGFKGDSARAMGLVDDIGQVLDDDKFLARIEELAGKEYDAINRSVSKRRTALRKGKAAAEKNIKDLNTKLDSTKKASIRAGEKVERLKGRMVTLEGKLRAQQSVVDTLQTQLTAAKRTRSGKRGALTKKLNEATEQMSVWQKQLDNAKAQYEAAENNFGRLANELSTAEAAHGQVVKQLDEISAAQKELETGPLTRNIDKQAEKFDKNVEQLNKAQEKFTEVSDEYTTATQTVQFLDSTVTQVSDKASQTLKEYEDWLRRVESTPQNKRGTAEQAVERDMVREQLEDVRQILKNTGDPRVQDMAKLEAQAIMADAAALMAGRQRKRLVSEFTEAQDLMNNPRFAEMMKDQINATMERMKVHMGDDAQINSWYRETVEFQKKFNENPGAFLRGFKRVASKYQKAMNWWKGWALSSPGFLFRNMYSGMFAAYLDDIPQQAIGRFARYHHKMMSDGVESAQQWAVTKYGKLGAQQLDEAHRVASASGWGITASEFADDPIRQTWSKNPLTPSTRNPGASLIRAGSEHAEAYLRGGHALGVLQRGGNYDEALGRVQKFHFNYRDISDYDRAIKQVIPFWTFFSRNLGLQAQVFAKKPQKLTRSYFNVKRNIEAMSDDDGEPMPGWMRAMQPIRTPWGSAEGKGRMYLTPDIPSVRMLGQAGELGGAGLVQELISSMGPGIKTPIQLATNRNMFLDSEYKNSLERYSDDGYVPRDAPAPFQLPGVRNVLQHLPGVENIDGRLLMQDNVEDALMQINPAIGRAARLFPNNDRQQETFRQYWTNFAGGPLRWNDPGSQAGAIASDRYAAEDAARAAQERARLIAMVNEGK